MQMRPVRVALVGREPPSRYANGSMPMAAGRQV